MKYSHKQSFLKLSCVFEKVLNFCLVGSNNLVLFVVPGTLNQEECRHGLDAVGVAQIWTFIDIDFNQKNSIWVTPLDGFGTDHFARSAPGGMTVDDGDFSVLLQQVIDLIGFGCVKVWHLCFLKKLWKKIFSDRFIINLDMFAWSVTYYFNKYYDKNLSFWL